MELPRDLVLARFVRRVNRFAALVRLDSRDVLAHVPNSGRGAWSIWRPGARRAGAPPTTWPWSRLRRRWSAWTPACPAPSSARPSRGTRWPSSRATRASCAEVRYGDSRIDALLEDERGSALVETKSITLVRRGTALFPDAPTSRGTRHLRALMQARREGLRAAARAHGAAVCFVVQREDPWRFRPYDAADAVFGPGLAGGRPPPAEWRSMPTAATWMLRACASWDVCPSCYRKEV